MSDRDRAISIDFTDKPHDLVLDLQSVYIDNKYYKDSKYKMSEWYYLLIGCVYGDGVYWDTTPKKYQLGEIIIKGNQSGPGETSVINHLVPCIRNTTNEVGFFDIILNRFYSPAREGKWFPGNIIESKYDFTKDYEVLQYVSYNTRNKNNTIPYFKTSSILVKNGQIQIECDNLNWADGTITDNNSFFGDKNNNFSVGQKIYFNGSTLQTY